MASRSFRDNNPGNLRYGNFAIRHGAIGEDRKGVPDGMPGYAIFPTWWSGLQAMGDLLHLPVYQALDVRGLINRYAPAGDKNDTAAYVTKVCLRAGCRPETQLAKMTPVQFLALMEAMVVHEGWIPPGQ